LQLRPRQRVPDELLRDPRPDTTRPRARRRDRLVGSPTRRVRRMKQGVSLITLGVSDYERAKSFYAALGWSPALEIEETAFFQANGVVLVLWAREKLAADSGIADDGASWSGITLAHNVGSRQEVDDLIEQARRAAAIAREPSDTFYGGYAGVFR